jgi:hypothetical protein
MEDILYLPAPTMGQKYRTLKDNRSYESHRSSRKSQKSLEAKKRSRAKPNYRRPRNVATGGTPCGLRPAVEESVSDIETVPVPVPIRDDVTALRIRLPSSGMEVEVLDNWPLPRAQKSSCYPEILDNWMEEENDAWDDGWHIDDWDQFYAYQDYLAEKREAYNQLYSDWDWLSGWP